MNQSEEFRQSTRPDCLTAEELYLYISKTSGNEASALESHLANCPHCRDELAGILELLHPEGAAAMESAPELSSSEIEDTVRLIQRVSRAETGLRHRWIQWAAAAAAIVILTGSGFWGVVYLRDKVKSNNFYARAKAELERVYDGKSPGDLRLDLPFRSTAVSRDASSTESLHQAETLFHQALALSDGMGDAHLGLASIYLSQSRFGLALAEFQTALESKGNDPRALIGRGVTRFEQANQSTDALRRSTLLSGALEDFDAALRQYPSSTEALYDKAWALFEAGRHREALLVIERYLSMDSDSLWAGKLRNLKSRINLTNSMNVEKEVERAAAARDFRALSILANLAPYQAPAAIRYALRQSLEADELPLAPGRPRTQDLIWASQVLESAYGAVAGDRSYKKLLRFYGGLSPPQRRAKRSLDSEFRKLVGKSEKRDFKTALQESWRLERQYAVLQDLWQLHNVYHLRGNCFYYGQADFLGALASYRRMLSVARQIGSPDLIVEALGSLAVACLEQRRLELARDYARALRELAGRYQLLTWQAYGSLVFGDLYRYLNLLEDSRREYSDALRKSYPLNYEVVLLNSLENLGSALDSAGHPIDAQLLYAEAIKQQEAFQASRTSSNKLIGLSRRLNLLYKQGNLFMRLGDSDRAESFFNESLRSSTDGMRELEARNRLALAGLCLRQKQYERAGIELEKVLNIASCGQYPEVDWRARYLKGKLFHETGADTNALASLESAIGIIEKMRAAVNGGESRQYFLDQRYDPYKAIVSLLFHSFGDKDKAHEYVERSKSMTLREHLKATGIESIAGRSNLPGLQPELLGTMRVAVLDYFVGDDEVFIFLDGRTRQEAVSMKIARADLEREVEEFRASIRTHDTVLFEALSRKIYGRLLEPVRASLDNDKPDLLLVLPDGPLHMLPFGALEDMRGRYFIENHVLVYAPSRHVYEYSLSLNRASRAAARSILLLDGSANLNGASVELGRLSRLYGRGARILDERELADCGRLASQYDILHFAGHAENNTGTASLVFRSMPGEFRLDSGIIGGWTLTRTRLVNLAGCSTGIGPRAEGEAPWGLVPAFLRAGAPAILASLLPVDDTSTELFNSRFYELLISGLPPTARALQQAQLALLAASRAAGAPNPSAWAPYVLIGDPR